MAAGLLPTERTVTRPGLQEVDTALRDLRALDPRDAYDEAALHEAGVLLLRLRDSAQSSHPDRLAPGS